jgi:hypothetical protein
MLGDGARANLFEVTLRLPRALETLPGVQSLAGQGIAETSRFLVRAAQLPGSTIGTVNVPYFGREVKFAGNRTFADWTVTVINDEDFKIKNTFERWLDYVNSHAGNRRQSSDPANKLDYFAQLGVTQYSKSGGAGIKKYTFVDAFPVDVSPIDLNWGDNDSIEEFTITFAYQYWISDTTDQKNPG